jgi:2-polyprenyl-6-methoxyphenol hydroxylase-like FAD-dependent oxidoreductase
VETNHDVLIVGAGPVGLMLATELQLAGVAVLVVERRTEPDTAIKAAAINAASAEAFARRGLLSAVEEVEGGRGRPPFAGTVGHFGGIQVPGDSIDLEDPTLRGHGSRWYVPIPQVEVERILTDRAVDLGVVVRRGVEVDGFDADESGVTVHLGAGGDVRVTWLVGCDGGRSMVRRQAGFEFPGTDPLITGRQAIATVEGSEQLGRGWQYTPTGLYVLGMGGWVRTVELDGPPADRDAPITAVEMEASLRRVSGADVRIPEVFSGSRYTDNARQAPTYRSGRVLLCGDAAHVHSPFSGQGLNLGIGDAVNLGWKLAATVKGLAPTDLLDSYTSERHPIGAWVLDWTRAQIAVMRGDAYSRASRAVVTDFLGTSDGATYYVKQVSGLWQRYDLGNGHPLVGAMTPDLQLDNGMGLYECARGGRFLLVDSEGDGRVAALAQTRSERLELVRGRLDSGVGGLLVRPDGFVAWANATETIDYEGLEAALKRWIG